MHSEDVGGTFLTQMLFRPPNSFARSHVQGGLRERSQHGLEVEPSEQYWCLLRRHKGLFFQDGRFALLKSVDREEAVAQRGTFIETCEKKEGKTTRQVP